MAKQKTGSGCQFWKLNDIGSFAVKWHLDYYPLL